MWCSDCLEKKLNAIKEENDKKIKKKNKVKIIKGKWIKHF